MSLDQKCGNSIHQSRMCNPSRPIHVVQLHGKGDTVIQFCSNKLCAAQTTDDDEKAVDDIRRE